MNILDIFTLLSYAALNIDILFQIRRIHRTQSSHDISLIGATVRYGAILIILIKFISLSDIPLIIGQVLVMLTFTTYIVLAFHYMKHRARVGRSKNN